MGLFAKLRQAFAAPAPPTLVLDHPSLGRLQYDSELEAWRVTVSTGAGALALVLYGDATPHPMVLQQAEALVESAARFQADILSFLEAEAVRQKEWASEIGKLTHQDGLLYPPKRDDAVGGMVCCSGPDQYRLWRCDLDLGQPHHLTYDS